MERRNRSLIALKELQYVDSLDNDNRASSLLLWFEKYLSQDSLSNFDLESNDLTKLSELFYKNINFLKEHRQELRQEIIQNNNIKKFLAK
jgi:hypothetical protein